MLCATFLKAHITKVVLTGSLKVAYCYADLHFFSCTQQQYVEVTKSCCAIIIKTYVLLFFSQIYENGRLGFFLDASDENSSSWMRFIQCARHKGEQNLYVFQYYGSVYYRAFKDIPVGTELLVWYDEKYPQYFGLPTEIRDMSNCSVESK